jgi:hypothetical protein
MNKIILLSSVLCIFLSACRSAPVPATPTLSPLPTATPPPTETSQPPTESPTATEDGTVTQIKSKFEAAKIDMAKMGNATYDQNGLHIVLASGEVVIPNDQLGKLVYNGQDGVFQIRDEANQNVVYAYDPETQTFLEASKFIQKDNSDPEKYIQVKNMAELQAVWAKENLFLIPFDPEKTYFPPLDKIWRGYDDRTNQTNDGEYNFYYPFGKLPEGMDSPFKPVNYIRMARDSSVIGSKVQLVITEQVFNKDDNSFSELHFMKGDNQYAVKDIDNWTSPEKFLLPRFLITPATLNDPTYNVVLRYYREKGMIDTNGRIAKIEELMYQFFETGHMPAELEDIPLIFKYNFIY